MTLSTQLYQWEHYFDIMGLIVDKASTYKYPIPTRGVVFSLYMSVLRSMATTIIWIRS